MHTEKPQSPSCIPLHYAAALGSSVGSNPSLALSCHPQPAAQPQPAGTTSQLGPPARQAG